MFAESVSKNLSLNSEQLKAFLLLLLPMLESFLRSFRPLKCG